MRILLTAIFKDDSEYEYIERMLASFMPHMAGLCVAITGLSHDNKKIKALIKKYNGKYIETDPENYPNIYSKDNKGYFFSNFAAARNACFELASTLGEYDYWSWADKDDILVNGEELDAVAAQAKKSNLDSVFFTYWYSIKLKKDGSFTDQDVVIEHLRERLLKPNIFKWVSRLHEIAVPKDDNYKPQHSLYDYNPKEQRGCVWAHVTTNEYVLAAMTRNIRILEQQAKEEEHKDPRTVFYLAKTYYDQAGLDNKPEYYQLSDLLIDDYLEKSGWAEERSTAWEYKGNIKAKFGNHRDAIACYHKAIEQYGNRPMPFLLLAKEYAEVNDMENSSFWLDTALKMEEPRTRTTIGNPLELKFLAASLKYNESLRKNNIDEAIKWLKIRNDVAGIEDDGMLKTLEGARQLNQAALNLFNYAKWLKDNNHADKVKKLLEAIPIDLGREAFVHIISNEYREPVVWPEKSIVYYASWGVEHFEKWSPKNLQSGIGGSETAVIELAKRWAQQGYKVTVFGDPREEEGEHDGVTYLPWYTINWKDTFDTIILWRSPHLLDKDIKARRVFMDLHDVASQLDWTDARMKKVNKVFFKSKYHRSMIPKLPDEKARIISNGI